MTGRHANSLYVRIFTTVLLVSLVFTIGCNDTFRQNMVPGFFDGVNSLADELLGESCEGLNLIVDSLFDGLEAAAYPEATSSS